MTTPLKAALHTDIMINKLSKVPFAVNCHKISVKAMKTCSDKYTVVGQNGCGQNGGRQNGTDKMVWTK